MLAGGIIGRSFMIHQVFNRFIKNQYHTSDCLRPR